MGMGWQITMRFYAVIGRTVDGVYVDCKATGEGYCLVFARTKICSGKVYKGKDTIKTEDLFFDPQKWAESLTDISKRTPKEIDGLEYTFESGM